MTVQTQRYRAWASDTHRCRAEPIVEADGFLDAAIQFAERCAVGRDEVSITVVDEHTGERQCFRIDLASGEAEQCRSLAKPAC